MPRVLPSCGRSRARSVSSIAVTVLMGILSAAFPSAVGAKARVDAGALVARTREAPWDLSFAERSGRVVLRQQGGTGAGPTGSLGFKAAGRWLHGTRSRRVRRVAGRYRATLATNDPRGRQLVVTLNRDAAGVIRLTARVRGPGLEEVTHTGIAFRARAGERYLGFGERSNAVDQRGHEVENYVAEGPFEEDERAFVPAFVPAWGFHPRDDATYFPMPWLLSTAGYGVLVDGSAPSVFRLGTDSRRAWSVEVESPRLGLRVFAGPRPAGVLRRLSARIGRQPPPPAPFVFGPWYQPRDDEQAILDRLQRADVPLSVAQTYTHYLPCESQGGRREAERLRVRGFHRAGLAVTTYFNPMICTDHTRYGEAAARGALIRNAQGKPYVFRYSTLERFVVSTFDFTARAGRDLYGRLLGEAIADGHDGWMEDFGEYTPLDARAAAGPSGPPLHNLYPVQYRCGARAAAPRSVRFARSGWTGSARCSPVVWGGDPSVDWGFDGLRSVVTNGLTMGLSGVSTWGSDIGGFFALIENRLTPELLIRWIQVGAVSGVMRTQANGIRIPDSPRPQVWDPEIVGHWRRWAKLRTQLYPYLAAADRAYRRGGLPIMRHLALAYPGDRRAVAQDDEFLFGRDLLAAPVLTAGGVTRDVYLPRGRWIDLWRSASYRASDGGLTLGRARVLRGRRRLSLPAPLSELPLLARAGTLLPLLPPEVDTLAAYGDHAPAVSLGDRSRRRVLLAFPRGRSVARLDDGGTLHSRELHRGWKLSIRSKRTRRWTIEASLAALRHRFRPCALRAVGGRLVRWRFDRRAKVLRATFRVRRGRLVALPCRG
jgi:alpha-D-xyloside xylohydrolase